MTAETMSHEQLLQENAVLQKQNEELSAAVSYWKNIYNSVNDVVFILNPQGTITQCNAATLRFFQLPEHEIVGRTCWSLIHGTSAPLDNCPFVRMLKTHRRETLIYESGNRILEIKADPIMGGSDSPQGAVHVVADVTARIRSEEARRDSEERFRAIAESSVDAIFITNEENIIFWNNAATRIFGFAKEDVIGKSTDLLMPEQVRVQSHAARKSFLETGETVRSNKPFETICLKKDGSSFPVEATLSNWKMHDRYHFGFIVRDISLRKKAETEREQLVQELQGAVSKIKTLKGLLPICASCKKIRDDQGYWTQIEGYIEDHSEAEFSHGMCPDCAKKYYGELLDKKKIIAQ